VHQAQRGEQISLGDLTFDVLHPTLPLGSDKNENSIVLELAFGQIDFLFTGDVESGGEASMLEAGLIDDIDILKVSHHGSKYCSTANFLAAAQPEIAIYSAGANNTYGHPAPETITRLCDIGAIIYGTDVHGTIVVMTDGMTYDIYPSNDVPPVDCSIPSDITHDPTTSVGNNVQITNIFYDGLVYRTESDEYVEITNLGSEPQDLAGWVLKDISDNGPSFTFPSYVLDPGQSIRVYTNEIHEEYGGFSFGYGQAIWQNDPPHDVSVLFNDQGIEVSRMSY
jgi:competence protein ComEC